MQSRIANLTSVACVTCGVGLIVGYITIPTLNSTVRFDRTEIRFDHLDMHTTGSQALAVRNGSRVPVRFEVNAECNCTHVEPAKGILPPGESLQLNISYRPKLVSDRMYSEEHSELRFRFEDDLSTSNRTLPIVASVFKPFVIDSSNFAIVQIGIRPATFEMSLSLMDDVKGIRVDQKAGFMAELTATEPQAPFNGVRLVGKTKLRSESTKLSDAIELSVVTVAGKTVPVRLPVTLVYQDVFRIAPESIRLSQGETVAVKLQESQPDLYYCEIVSVTSQVAGVSVSRSTAGDWEVSAADASYESGYIELRVKTEDRETLQQAFSLKYIAVLRSNDRIVD